MPPLYDLFTFGDFPPMSLMWCFLSFDMQRVKAALMKIQSFQEMPTINRQHIGISLRAFLFNNDQVGSWPMLQHQEQLT